MNEKIIREKTVCFTGHRSEKLPGGEGLELLRKRLTLEIERALQDGYDTFLFGGAYGFDLMAAEEVLKKKVLIDLQNPRYIRLIAVIPFEEQAVRFSASDHERYYEIMPQCNEVITLNTHYSSQCYGSQPHDIRSNFPLIEQAHRRLAKVVVENKDFGKLIEQYDRPVSFFYCDPPYFETESYYKNVGEDGFTEKDHIRLRDALMKAQGKFLLSYNDCAFIRDLYDAPGIQIDAYTRINNIKQRYDNGAQFPEILIANYDMQERSRSAPAQMNLFDAGLVGLMPGEED